MVQVKYKGECLVMSELKKGKYSLRKYDEIKEAGSPEVTERDTKLFDMINKYFSGLIDDIESVILMTSISDRQGEKVSKILGKTMGESWADFNKLISGFVQKIPEFDSYVKSSRVILNRMRGKILTIVESLGLSKDNEKATKDVLHDRLWSTVENHIDRIIKKHLFK